MRLDLPAFPRWIPVDQDGCDLAWQRDDFIVGSARGTGDTLVFARFSTGDWIRDSSDLDIEDVLRAIEAHLAEEVAARAAEAVEAALAGAGENDNVLPDSFVAEDPLPLAAEYSLLQEDDFAETDDLPNDLEGEPPASFEEEQDPFVETPDAVEAVETPDAVEALEEDADIVLSPDQVEAKNKLMRALTSGEQVLVLTGAAGTGKTSLVRGFVKGVSGFKVVYAAPTGKAASRLTEVTGQPCATVHSLIYGKPQEEGLCTQCECWSADMAISNIDMAKQSMSVRTCPECSATFPAVDEVETQLRFTVRVEDDEGRGGVGFGSRTLVVVDEASMVNEEMHSHLLGALNQFSDCRVLYVGDPYQLPPVNAKWGPDFEHPTATLTQVHRQAEGSDILNAATLMRTQATKQPFDFNAGKSGDFRIYRDAKLDVPCQWLAERRARGIDATLITYANKMRQTINHRVRELRGLAEAGERAGTSITIGDRLLVRSNNKMYGYMTGEVYTIEAIGWVDSAGMKIVEDKEVLKVKLVGRDVPIYLFEAVFGDKNNEFTSCIRDHKRAWEAVSTMASRPPPSSMKPVVTVESVMLDRKVAKLKELARDQAGLPEGIAAAAKVEELLSRVAVVPPVATKPNPFGGLLDPAQFVHCDYGECITAHTSQGSQYAEVGIVWNYSVNGLWKHGAVDIIQGQEVSEGRRWAYTAITRAQQKLNIWFV